MNILWYNIYMPRKNTVYRQNLEGSFYHVYNRGLNKMNIFNSDEDFRFFEFLIERMLSPIPYKNRFGREYVNYHGQIEVHSYCLMPNHFHFLFKQNRVNAIKNFISSLSIAYSAHFNKANNRSGPIFESRYKAILVEGDEYLKHLSRYIHLNPLGFRSWDYSSYNDFLYEPRPWVNTKLILGEFRTKNHYIAFVDDYREASDPSQALESLLGDT